MKVKNSTQKLEYNRHYIANLRAQRRANGLCITCGNPISMGRTECPECAKRYTQRRSELKRRAIEYLGGQCADCGLQTDIVAVYDFHHKDGGEKTAGLSDFLTLKNWQRMQEELDKCVLLCANCHRIRHALADKDIS
jgi:predicted RNA-binding Zn-ribbon protein involved in translation (DUF1610 family)